MFYKSISLEPPLGGGVPALEPPLGGGVPVKWTCKTFFPKVPKIIPNHSKQVYRAIINLLRSLGTCVGPVG